MYLCVENIYMTFLLGNCLTLRHEKQTYYNLFIYFEKQKNRWK